MKISQVIGRQGLIDYFVKAYQGGRLSHAYILEGDGGSGKKTLVEAVVNFLLCPHKEGQEICGQCRVCLQLSSQNYPDVIYVKPTKKTGYGVDDIRREILDEVNIRPYQSQYKVYIIEGGDKMTLAAQNVLLKTLEEPPAYAIFFLLVENKAKLLETVFSRCIYLKMPILTEAEMLAFVSQKGKEDLATYIPFADGNIGRLLEMAESENFLGLKRDLENLLDRFVKSGEHDIMEEVKALEKYEDDLSQALNVLQAIVRERLRKIYIQNRHRDRQYPAGPVEQKYYLLAQNILQAKKQVLANVNKNLILWNLFLP